MPNPIEPQAYVNGQWLPASQASIELTDAGFVLGATVSEQLRTFAGRLFRLDAHLDRFERSLAVAGISPGVTRAELAALAERLAATNHPLLPTGSDLGLAILATPGQYGSFAQATSRPTLILHTYPLAFARWAARYRKGDELIASTVELVSTRSWPAELKCRSRMHYYLADIEANRKSPGSRAILCDAAGNVRETAVANVVLVASAPDGSRTLTAAPKGTILGGISQGVVAELARQAGWNWVERDFTLDDLADSDEVLLTSTPWCVLSATQFEERPIGDGSPGPAYQQLIEAWSALVGVNIVEQAVRCAGITSG